MNDDIPLWLWLLFSALVLSIGLATRPTRARCPSAFHHNGVRRSGRFDCIRIPVGDPNEDGTWGHPDTSVVPPGELSGRIYCTGGMRPIVVDDRAVGCQRF